SDRDWSSDVCSSDLGFVHGGNGRDMVVLDKRVRNHVERCADPEIVIKADLVRSVADRPGEIDAPARFAFLDAVVECFRARLESRSEERRVGKEWRTA